MKIHILKRNHKFAWLVILLSITGCTQPSIQTPGKEVQLLPTIESLSSEVLPLVTSIPSEEVDTSLVTLQANQASDFDLERLKNLEYHLNILEEVLPESKGILQLNDGVYDNNPPGSAVGINAMYQQGVLGDLNGDGQEDAAALVAINTGGTGVFVHLVAFLNQEGEFKQAAELLIEDRTVINSFKIDDGVIYLQRIAHSSEDAMCCPSKVVDEAYVLESDRLIPQP
jgi:hypothetical protein